MFLALLAFLALPQAPSPVAAAEILTNAHVVRLVEAGIPADIIVEKIKRSACRFTTDTDALVDLATHKVPDPVLRAMLTAPVAGPVAVPAPPSVPEPAPAPSGAQRIGAAHDVEWKGAKSGPCRGDLVLTHEGFELRPASTTGCAEILRVPWTSVKRYCFFPTRFLGSAEIDFVGRESGARWSYAATTRASGAELGAAVDALRKSVVQTPEACQ